jgi:hypothetical protein
MLNLPIQILICSGFLEIWLLRVPIGPHSEKAIFSFFDLYPKRLYHKELLQKNKNSEFQKHQAAISD